MLMLLLLCIASCGSDNSRVPQKLLLLLVKNSELPWILSHVEVSENILHLLRRQGQLFQSLPDFLR